ncbi:MAG: cation-translocating P-type ATPase [Clostridia bacterium]|nr:cation-translocating P-type ATPase [Clostridia bacterium]
MSENKEEKKMHVTGIIEELFGPEVAAQKNAPKEEVPEEHTMEITVDEPTAEVPVSEEETSPDEDMKVYASKPGRKKNQEHSPFMKEENTAPLDLKPGKPVKVSIGHPLTEEDEEENDQLSFEGWEEEPHADGLDEETSPEGDLELVNQFRQNRESKVRSFKLKLEGDEEQTDPDEEIEEFEEEYVEDFVSYEDADAVSSELKYRSGKSAITLLVTGIWEFLLILAVFCFQFNIVTDPLVFVVGSLIILGIMMGFNWDMMRDGLEDLKEKTFGVEAAVMLTSCFAFFHTILQFFHIESCLYGLLPAVAGFEIFCTSLARKEKITRICSNFDFLSKDDKKWAAKLIDDEEKALDIGGASVATGVPKVAFFRPVEFLYRFLTVSYERRPELKRLKLFIPVLWGISLLGFLIYGVAFKDWWTALQLLGLGLCLAVPASLFPAMEGALLRAARISKKAGGLLASRNAVDHFGKMNAMVIDAAELFPSETVLLHGIKTFAGFRIDEAILDTAAVILTSGGPLADVFRRIIEDKKEILQPVEQLCYEHGMGISGWVGGHRVFVGNRRLLENHEIDTPSSDYEARYKKNGRQLVYLAVGGKIAAMYVVSYTPDKQVSESLKKLTKENITLLIHTCDANVTEELISTLFDIDPFYIEILNSNSRIALAHLVSEQMEEDTVTEAIADLACNNSLSGKAVPIALCNRLRIAFPITALVSIILSALTMLLIIIYFFALSDAPSVLYVLICQIIALIVTWITPLVKKV